MINVGPWEKDGHQNVAIRDHSIPKCQNLPHFWSLFCPLEVPIDSQQFSKIYRIMEASPSENLELKS